MVEFIIFIIFILSLCFKFNLLNINEELIICISLILFFLIGYYSLRKFIMMHFYNDLKVIHLIYYYLIILNNQLINNILIAFSFLINKLVYKNMSDFLILMLIVNFMFLHRVKFQSKFTLKFLILSWLDEVLDLLDVTFRLSFIFLLNGIHNLFFSGLHSNLHVNYNNNNNYYLC